MQRGALVQGGAQGPVQAVFDSASIFVQDVPAFEIREYCRTFTLPANAHLFELNSHTHRHGVLFRMWAPPNVQCTPGEPACVPRGDTPLYLSTDYTDPLQLVFDPPIDSSLLTDDEWRERAEMDRDDVLRADALVLFTEEGERSNGGRHVEFGLALATGKSIIVVGPKEHLFHRLPEVRVVASREEAVELLLSLAS